MNYAAEYVFPGHPDKLCDAIADALVEEAARREKRALCGIEVAVHRASVFITGRIACAGAESDSGRRDRARVLPLRRVRRRLAPRARGDRGADRLVPRPAAGRRAGVPRGLRRPVDRHGVCGGFAGHQLAAAGALAGVAPVARACSGCAPSAPELGLGPDGKVALIFDSEQNALAAFSASVQQKIGGERDRPAPRRPRRRRGRTAGLRAARSPGFAADLPEQFHVNGAGNFEVGGPEGDNGLSGKKLVVDAYGPRVPIGGGALSGKDFFKADRAGAVLARRLAKTVVAAGAAAECLATLAIFPGDPAFRIVSLLDGNGAAPGSGAMDFVDGSLAGVGRRTLRPDAGICRRWRATGTSRLPNRPGRRYASECEPIARRCTN